MTTFFLIRHGAHDLLGKTLTGRMPGISLNSVGVQQARWLATRLEHESIDAIYSSPLERSLQTAAPLAEALGISCQINQALAEIDFGVWCGRSFLDLGQDERWQEWNARRSEGMAPGGESMRAVQTRVVAEIDRLSLACPGQALVLVSHGDVIKAAVMAYLKTSLDEILGLEISPGSMSRLAVGPGFYKLQLLNETDRGRQSVGPPS